MNRTLIKQLYSDTIDFIACHSNPQDPYPHDIAFNIIPLEDKIICNSNYIDNTIKQHCLTNQINIIHTNQGYAKCSTMVIDKNNIITADNSIHNAAIQNGINSLLIRAGYISLPGYNYGFIGGASGVYNDTVYISGVLDSHPEKIQIEEFIYSCNKTIMYLSSLPAIDLGSFLFI